MCGVQRNASGKRVVPRDPASLRPPGHIYTIVPSYASLHTPWHTAPVGIPLLPRESDLISLPTDGHLLPLHPTPEGLDYSFYMGQLFGHDLPNNRTVPYLMDVLYSRGQTRDPLVSGIATAAHLFSIQNLPKRPHNSAVVVLAI